MGSVVSTMFCKAKSAKKKYAAILDHIQTKMFNSETTSFQRFSPSIPNLQKFWTSDFGKWGQNRLQNVPHEKGHQTHRHTDRHTDIATTRSNRPSAVQCSAVGRFDDNLDEPVSQSGTYLNWGWRLGARRY